MRAPAQKVYHAIADKDGPTNWWTRFAQCSDYEGGVSEFRFPQAGFYAAMQVKNLTTPWVIEWECIKQVHNKDTGWSDLNDWEGTLIRFEVEPIDEDNCVLHFEHRGLLPKLECYETCDSAWRYYLGESLKSLVETGQGMPFNDDSENNIQIKGN